MEIATQWLEVVGLAVTLILATYIFVRGVTLTLRGRHHQVKFGLELLFVFTLLYFVLERILNKLDLTDLAISVDNAVAFLWWIALAYTVNASLNRFVWNGLLAENGVRRIPKLLTDAAALFIYGGAIMIVLHYVYDKSIVSILATSGALAFIVGLSAQSTLSEVFAGISLNITKALRLGDFVEIDGVYGEVHEINWRSVSILNPHMGSYYIFPNTQVATKVILNYNEPTDLFKYYIKFWVEYSASPGLVISTISEALEKSRYICRDPKPDFNLLGFTDQGMEYRVRYYFEGDDPWWDAQNEMCMTIWSSLRQKGIRLSIDRHELLSGDEQEINPWLEGNLIKPDDDLAGLLGQTPLLQGISREQLEELTNTARFLDYTPPNCLYREGEHDESVYYISDGDFSILQIQADGEEALVGELGNGDLAGIRNLLDGENKPHLTTVRAERFSRVYRLDRELLANILLGSSERQSVLKNILDARQERETEYLVQHKDMLAKRARLAHHARLNLHLKAHVEDVFSKPVLHRVLHLLSSRSTEHDLLEALMAAAALITSARGGIEDVDKRFLTDKFEHIDLFKHVELEEAMKLFMRDVGNIQSDPQAGTKTALSRIGALASEPQLAYVVMGVAHGIADLHSDHSVEVEAQLLKIAKTLNLPAEIEDLTEQLASIKSESSNKD